jgi:hypothetical protein
MARHSPRVWLVDICEEIAGIRELTKTADLAAFANNWAMKRAVEHALLIVAEAAAQLPPEMKDSQPDVPWQTIASATCCVMNTGASIPRCYGRSSLSISMLSIAPRRRFSKSSKSDGLGNAAPGESRWPEQVRP